MISMVCGMQKYLHFIVYDEALEFIPNGIPVFGNKCLSDEQRNGYMNLSQPSLVIEGLKNAHLQLSR